MRGSLTDEGGHENLSLRFFVCFMLQGVQCRMVLVVNYF